jgi:hypothetical protein
MLNHPQVLRATQLGHQGTATLFDELREVHLGLSIPSVLLSAATENDAAALPSREYVCGFTIAVRGAEVHLADWLLRAFH